MSPLRKLLLLIALCALLAVVWWVPPDARATQQVDAGLKRALTSFAAARALDAVISVAQGTQIALEPGGVGVVLAPGQALDPINDLVEQFSTLMLLASVSFGVQRALIAIGSHVAVSALVTAAALGWAALRWRGRPPLGLTRLLLVLLLARFAVPLVVLGSDLVFQTFLSSDYAAAQRAIDGSARQIDQAGSPAPAARAPADEGHVERLKRWWATAVDKPDVGKRLEELRQIASGAADHIVRLIVVFLLQTLVLPLLLLWSLLGLGRGLYAVIRRAH